MEVGGLFSEGVAHGHATGFDSGSTLDYVYRNTPQGKGALGRFIDRGYLESIGWRGIRQRKVNLEELLRRAMTLLREKGMPVRVLDIAAGHGRYVIEALAGSDVMPDTILLRDYSDINVAAGTRLIADKGLSDIARFVKGDAFDRDSLAMIEPKPTLGIVSGLYELFPDNARSLEGLAAAIPQGSYLVCTSQPWHPHSSSSAGRSRATGKARPESCVPSLGFSSSRRSFT
jgi:putative methyltransferase